MGATAGAVLSGKGGVAKTMWISMMAAEASRAGLRTLLVDIDPERNLSNRHKVPQHSTGIGNVLEAAGLTTGDTDPEQGAKRLDAELVPSLWPGVDLLPAGSSLAAMSEISVDPAQLWMLAETFEAADVDNRWDLALIDTGGRRGSLVSMAMYAADAAFAPIAPTTDAVRKALEARNRVKKIQRAHALRWAGVVLSGFDLRNTVDDVIRADAYKTFGDQVRAEVPRRAAVNEAFQLGDRLGDRSDVQAQQLAAVFRGFLLRDLMGRELPAGITASSDGVIR